MDKNELLEMLREQNRRKLYGNEENEKDTPLRKAVSEIVNRTMQNNEQKEDKQ